MGKSAVFEFSNYFIDDKTTVLNQFVRKDIFIKDFIDPQNNAPSDKKGCFKLIVRIGR
jgi:hypothetical protein